MVTSMRGLNTFITDIRRIKYIFILIISIKKNKKIYKNNLIFEDTQSKDQE